MDVAQVHGVVEQNSNFGIFYGPSAEDGGMGSRSVINGSLREGPTLYRQWLIPFPPLPAHHILGLRPQDLHFTLTFGLLNLANGLMVSPGEDLMAQDEFNRVPQAGRSLQGTGVSELLGGGGSTSC